MPSRSCGVVVPTVFFVQAGVVKVAQWLPPRPSSFDPWPLCLAGVSKLAKKSAAGKQPEKKNLSALVRVISGSSGGRQKKRNQKKNSNYTTTATLPCPTNGKHFPFRQPFPSNNLSLQTLPLLSTTPIMVNPLARRCSDCAAHSRCRRFTLFHLIAFLWRLVYGTTNGLIPELMRRSHAASCIRNGCQYRRNPEHAGLPHNHGCFGLSEEDYALGQDWCRLQRIWREEGDSYIARWTEERKQGFFHRCGPSRALAVPDKLRAARMLVRPGAGWFRQVIDHTGLFEDEPVTQAEMREYVQSWLRKHQ